MSNNNALLLLEHSNKEGAIISYDEKGLAVNVRKGRKISPELMKKLKEGKNLLISHFEEKQIQKDRQNEAEYTEINGNKYYAVGSKQDFWMYHNSKDSTAGKLTYEFRISGEVDLTAFRNSVTYLFNRHESLRATFHRQNDTNFMQVVAMHLDNFQYYDVRAAENKLALIEQKRSFQELEFNLKTGPLCVLRLIHAEDDQYILCLLAHHIIFDKLSKEIFLRELLMLYAEFASGNEVSLLDLPFQFKEHLFSESKFISRNKEAHTQFWRDKFPGLPNEFISPIEKIGNPVRSNQSKVASIPLQSGLMGKVNEFARDYNTTAFIVLQAVFHLARLKVTRQEDTILGSAIFRRNHTGFENQIGYYAEIVLIRTIIRLSDSFPEIIQTVKQANDNNDDFRSYSLMDHTWNLLEGKQKVMTGFFWKANIRFVDERSNSVSKVQACDLKFEQVKAKQDHHITLDFDWHFIVDNKNNMSVMVRYDDGLYEHEGIAAFTNKIEEVLMEL